MKIEDLWQALRAVILNLAELMAGSFLMYYHWA